MENPLRIIRDMKELEAFIGLRSNINANIARVIRALGEEDIILNIDDWRLYTLENLPYSAPTDYTGLFRIEPRENGVHKVIRAVWETPEDGAESQKWIRAEYTALSFPEDVQEDRVIRFPARYLFLSDTEVIEAWEKHQKANPAQPSEELRKDLHDMLTEDGIRRQIDKEY